MEVMVDSMIDSISDGGCSVNQAVKLKVEFGSVVASAGTGSPEKRSGIMTR